MTRVAAASSPPCARPSRAWFLGSAWGIAVAAFAIRLAVLAWMYGISGGSAGEEHFPPTEAAFVARSLATGHGFSSPLPSPTGPTALVPPIFPLLLAGVFRALGVFSSLSGVVILAINSLFSALTCAPIFALAQRSFGKKTAVACAWTWAVFPSALYIPVHFVWEASLAAFLAATLLLFTVRLEESAGLASAMGYGFLWGLAGLTNPSLLAALPLLGGWLVWRWERRRAGWPAPAALAAAAFLLVVTPWFVRNFRTFGQFVPFRSGFGLELYLGNGPETEVRRAGTNWPYARREWLHPYNNLGERREMERLGEIAYMQEKKRKAEAFIATHPGAFALLTLERVAFIWTGIWSLTPGYLLSPLGIVSIPFMTAVSLLALSGLRRAMRRGDALAWPCALGLAGLPLVYYVTHVNMRFRHPMEPILVLLSVFTVAESRGWPSETPRAPGRSIGREPRAS